MAPGERPSATAILQAVHRAAPPGATLLLIEQLIPDEPGPHWAKTLDIHMLVLLGGLQRSRGQYAALLEAVGFSAPRQIDTRSDVAILESVAESE